jgi:hypothetical protein
MGVYGSSTFNQGEPVTPPAQAPGATSSCTTTSTIGNNLPSTQTPALAVNTTSAVRTLVPLLPRLPLSSPDYFTDRQPHEHRVELRPYEGSNGERGWCAHARQEHFRGTCGGIGRYHHWGFPSLMNSPGYAHFLDDTTYIVRTVTCFGMDSHRRTFIVWILSDTSLGTFAGPLIGTRMSTFLNAVWGLVGSISESVLICGWLVCPLHCTYNWMWF